MKTSSEPSNRSLRGVAALFDDFERKELFRKYLFFLGWIEVLILAICWLYRLGNGGYDSYGPVEIGFPWKAYFLVSFLAPVAISFLVGVVIVGFNKYFSEPGPSEESLAEGEASADGVESDRIRQLNRIVSWVQKLPFLALLLLLGVGAVFFYKIDAFLGFIAQVGETSVKIVLISAAVLVGLASIFGLILIVLNYQLRKRTMEYQYKSEVAERFGLIILEDNTVLSREGKLLIQGKKFKDVVPLLPEGSSESPPEDSSSTALVRSPDLETS